MLLLQLPGSFRPWYSVWSMQQGTGRWTLPVAGAIGFLVLGIIMSFRIRPDRRIMDIVAIGDATANVAI
jgi:hypothetical protein